MSAENSLPRTHAHACSRTLARTYTLVRTQTRSLRHAHTRAHTFTRTQHTPLSTWGSSAEGNRQAARLWPLASTGSSPNEAPESAAGGRHAEAGAPHRDGRAAPPKRLSVPPRSGSGRGVYACLPTSARQRRRAPTIQAGSVSWPDSSAALRAGGGRRNSGWFTRCWLIRCVLAWGISPDDGHSTSTALGGGRPPGTGDSTASFERVQPGMAARAWCIAELTPHSNISSVRVTM